MWGNLEKIEASDSERVLGEARGCSVDEVGPLVREVHHQSNASEVASQQTETEREGDGDGHVVAVEWADAGHAVRGLKTATWGERGWGDEAKKTKKRARASGTRSW